MPFIHVTGVIGTNTQLRELEEMLIDNAATTLTLPRESIQVTYLLDQRGHIQQPQYLIEVRGLYSEGRPRHLVNDLVTGLVQTAQRWNEKEGCVWVAAVQASAFTTEAGYVHATWLKGNAGISLKN